MKSLTRDRLTQILEAMRGRKILIIGDVMMDMYILGTVSRISPEAPVPVVNIKSEKVALGGAANVASNIKALGGIPVMVGVVGTDDTARTFKDTVESKDISTEFLVTDSERPTTKKTRVVAHNQQVVRIDQEQSQDISKVVEKKVLATANSLMKQADAVLLEDYNKGLLTTRVIGESIKSAQELGKAITVDPKTRNFFDFSGATLFKPNEKELLGAVGEVLAERMDDEGFLRRVKRRIGCKNLLITRGDRGMTLIGQDGTFFSIPTVAREVYDVSGAGDTVISTATLALSVGATSKEAAIVANYAAGVEVSKWGVAAITPEEILAYFDLLNGSTP
ncbi:MAG: D-glycero-beta-D-manno-heptose-7-phosphate kinase [Candidatus Glassbacteria bacterium]